MKSSRWAGSKRLLGEDLFDPDELDALAEIQNVEREVTTKSGERRTVLMHLKRVAISGGTVLCTCRDVTALKEAERQLAVARLELAHAARLALVGELTASIVHEIQQPLTAIAANNEAAAIHVGRLPADARGELGGILTDIHEAISSAAEIIDRLRGLARKRPMEPEPVDVNELLAGLMRLMSSDALRRRVRMSIEPMPLLPKIPADRISLQHVVLNLVINAMEAMESHERTPRSGAADTARRQLGRARGVRQRSRDRGRYAAEDFRSLRDHQARRNRARTFDRAFYRRRASRPDQCQQRAWRRRHLRDRAAGDVAKVIHESRAPV